MTKHQAQIDSVVTNHEEVLTEVATEDISAVGSNLENSLPAKDSDKPKETAEEKAEIPLESNACKDKDKKIKSLETELRKLKKLCKDQEAKLKENDEDIRDLENESNYLKKEAKLLRENKKVLEKLNSVLEKEQSNQSKKKKKKWIIKFGIPRRFTKESLE